MVLTSVWAGLKMVSVDDPEDPVFESLKSPIAPEYQEEYDQYKHELRTTGGFGISSPYGSRLDTGIRCVENEDLSDPTLVDLGRFAVEDDNQHAPNLDPVVFLSIEKVNYEIFPYYVAYYITLKARTISKTSKGGPGVPRDCTHFSIVCTCFEGCKTSGGLTPFLPRRPHFDVYKELAFGDGSEFDYQKFMALELQKRMTKKLARVQKKSEGVDIPEGMMPEKLAGVQKKFEGLDIQEGMPENSLDVCQKFKGLDLQKGIFVKSVAKKKCWSENMEIFIRGDMEMRRRQRMFDERLMLDEQMVPATEHQARCKLRARKAENEVEEHPVKQSKVVFFPAPYRRPIVAPLRKFINRDELWKNYAQKHCVHVRNKSISELRPASYMRVERGKIAESLPKDY